MKFRMGNYNWKHGYGSVPGWSSSGGGSSILQAAFVLDGSNEDVRSTDDASTILTDYNGSTLNFTWTVWFKADDETPASDQGIWGASSTANNFHLILLTTGILRFQWAGGGFGGTREMNSTNAISGGGWHSVVIKFHSDLGAGWDGKMWVDGVNDATRAAAAPAIEAPWGAHKLTVGLSGSAYLAGKVCQWGLWPVYKSDAICGGFHAIGGSTNIKNHADWGSPLLYIRGVDTDTTSSIGQTGTLTAAFSGTNMESADIATSDVPA